MTNKQFNRILGAFWSDQGLLEPMISAKWHGTGRRFDLRPNTELAALSNGC